ncbi:MAG TPA: hypothetical protein VFW19_08265 [Allosphingosinicella sp.]|nr:hypothetical protein [Allosphingosinicella sp.]
MGVWERLGIAPTKDSAEIRRAYARALKAIDPEADPEAFVQLRGALQWALRSAQAAAAGNAPPPEPSPPRPGPGIEAGPGPVRLQLDEGPIRAIQAALFGDGEEDPEAVAAAIQALLADPALEQVELSRRIEALIAQWIVQGAPRSDPMIEPAIAHFRWDDSRADDLRRPDAIQWILQRRRDRQFEADLIAADERKYGSLLQSLRRPPAGIGPLAGWWRAPRVEYLLAYCGKLHPTVLSGLDRQAIEQWDQRSAEMRMTGGLVGHMARMRRNVVWQAGLYENGRTASAAWPLLVLVGILGLMIWSNHMSRPSPVVPRIHFLAYTSPEQDLDPLLGETARGGLRMTSLALLAPELHDRLVARWRQARDGGEDFGSFFAAARRMIDNAYRTGLRAGGYDVEVQYWRLRAKQLRWLSRDPDECDAYMRDGSHAQFPPEFDALDAQAHAAAIMAGGTAEAEDPAAPTAYRFSIPHALFHAAARRAGLAEPVMAASLLDGGTHAQRCAARIALIDEALAEPRSVAAPFLRKMSSGL